VVWDGVRDYRNMPPPGVMVLEFPPGPGDIHIVQIGKPPTNIRQILDALTGERSVYVILWARDHRIYRAIIDELECTGPRLQRQAPARWRAIFSTSFRDRARLAGGAAGWPRDESHAGSDRGRKDQTARIGAR
jgi:hypothetical protein